MSSRHLAYVGEPVTLQGLVLDPPRSLAAQSVSPHLQLHGVVNADGFGAGWYAFGLINSTPHSTFLDEPAMATLLEEMAAGALGLA